MSTHNGIEPAFPSQHLNSQGEPWEPSNGLTKRELFAAMAMQGICANTLLCSQNIPAAAIAAWSAEQADALLTELAK